MKSFVKLKITVISLICLLVALLAACSTSNSVRTTIDSIDELGNVRLSASAEEMLEIYSFGDVVTVAIDDRQYVLPVVSSYSDVDDGEKLLLLNKEKQPRLAISHGNFADTAGIIDDMLSVEVKIDLKEKEGYREEWEIRHLERSNERNDYPALNDQDFSNFRNIATTGMGKNVLYRTSSPIDPKIGRNTYADLALRQAGVQTILNLSDEAEDMLAFDGFEDTYYSKQRISAIQLTIDTNSRDFQEGLAYSLRYMTQNPGPYAIHCLEGKDRTGFACAVLECLMGASSEEVIEDYMKTYENFYSVKKDETRYNAIAESSIVKLLNIAFDLADGSSVVDDGLELSSLAEEYLYMKLGLTEEEIQTLKLNLSTNY